VTDLASVARYLRACDYLALAMIYLRDNVLVREPLRREHLRGTCPGLAMSTRSGTVVPGMLLWLIEHAGLGAAQVREQLSAEAGLFGLSGGRSGDTRDLVGAVAEDGEAGEAARFALEVFCHRSRGCRHA
jgi:Acetokinase family/XFP N-terminal domain